MTCKARPTPLPAGVRTRRLLQQQKPLWVREALVDELSADTLEQWWNQLDDDERRRAERLISNDRRKETIAAHGLLRGLAGDIANVDPEVFRLARPASGQKPRLLSDLSHELDVNLTHCAAFAACVVSYGCEVGIDAEVLRRSVSAAELFPHFAPEEQQWLSSLAPARADRAALQLWSLKEAAVKAIGRGISIDLACFALLPKPPRLLRTTPILGDIALWRFWQFHPTDHHILSIAAKASGVPA